MGKIIAIALRNRQILILSEIRVKSCRFTIFNRKATAHLVYDKLPFLSQESDTVMVRVAVGIPPRRRNFPVTLPVAVLPDLVA